MLLKYYQKLDDAISYLFSSVCNEKKLLKSNLSNKINYVDIGTNEGNFLNFMMDNFELKNVFCFEPIKDLSENLKQNFKEKNFHINQIALSNKKGLKKFYEYEISSQSSLHKQNDTFKSLKKLKKISKVKTMSFDEFFSKNQKIDFCKIDVQGEEVKVLEGMKNNLKKKNIKLLKIEISFIERYIGIKSNFNKITNFLNNLNYQLISISKIKYRKNKILLMDAYFELK
tara:strand:- start:89 stop:772 length:684 start_codon:yes stop_codon:yes gene_type:complete